MSTNKTHYQFLGVDPTASEDEIKKAYKRLARTYHPDLNPKRPRSAEDRFKRLQQAYDVLSDPVSRERYDQEMGYFDPQPAPQYQPQAQRWPRPHSPDYTTYQGGFETVHAQSDEPGWKSIIRGISWRRRLALGAWALCLLGSFLPTSYNVVFSWNEMYEISFLQRLVWITVPLVMIWVGTWLSEDGGGMDMSLGTIIKEGFGVLLQGLAGIYFARLIGLMFLGPLVLWFS